ncbi:tape measure protein [Spirosoma endbachense]|uniref:Tape measure protein n=1 Tax=Spirosoma endbachense TaxID=2666025 RepID=A0A6P1VV46_9BACT|nr:tape measure protein [Spirosoma endbachense]QHV96298.1 tape measure protein [Spirosoma endbachense]
MAGAVNIKLGAVVTDFVAGFRAAGAAAGQLATQLNGNVVASFAAADRQSRQFERGLGRVASGMQSFGRTTSLVSAGITALGVASFHTYGEIDGIQRALKVTAGSAQEATKQFAEFRQLARLPGLGLEEVTQAGLQLETLGFKAQTAEKYVSEVGNAIALGGKGKVEFAQVITQFTQMAGKAKVLGDDLKPIITASPVISKAITDMFGTVDSEQISAKLQAVGRSPKDFINDLVLNLSKLERVEGGPKNALENLGDGLKIAQFQFASAADKAFGLTELIDRIGNAVGSLADRFTALSPTTQKVILTVAGLVAAIGPLALGIGGLLALVPSVVAGSAAITTALGVSIGPILLVGAAIAGVAVLVATNWDYIKTVLTNSGIWQSVKDLVGSAMGFVRSVFTVYVGYIQGVWARFGGFFTTIAKGAFEAVVAVFKFGAGILQGIFSTLTGLLTGNWSQFGNGLLVVAKSIWNLLIDGFKLMAGTIGRTIASIFQLFGATSLADKITAGIDKALSKLDGLKGSIQSVQAVAKAGVSLNVATGNKAGGKTTKDTPKPFDYLNSTLGSKSEIQKAKEELKKLKDAIASGILAGKDVSTLQTQYDLLKNRVDAATDSFKAHKATHESLNPTLTTNERILKRLTQELKQQGLVPNKALQERVALFKQLVADEKELANFKPVNLGDLKPIAVPNASNQRVNSLISSGGVTTPGLNGSTASIGLPGLTEFQQRTSEQLRDAQLKLTEDKQQLRFALADFPNMFGSVKDEMQRVAESDPLNTKGLISSVLSSAQSLSGAISSAKDTLVSGSIDLLASIGEGLGSGKLSFKSIIKSIIDMIADAAITIGKALIVTGLPFLANPLTASLGLKQILTGGAIVLAGGVAKGLAGALLSDNTKGFAKGGLFRSESLIRVGESSRATSGGLGEWVSPVGLGADLISERIMKNLGAPQVNRPDVNSFRAAQPQLVKLSGEARFSGGDLYMALEDFKQTNEYYS